MRAAWLLGFAALGGCAGEVEREGAALDPVVMTTFYPTTFVAERIAGGTVDVRCPLPRDADPIFWQPDRATLQAYQRAALVVINGAGLERWVGGASLPPSRVVDSAAAFESRWMRYEQATVHSHGAVGEHVHEGLDGHTWLDPVLLSEQADAILAGMIAAFPEHADALRENHAALEADLDELHRAWQQLAEPLGRAQLLAAHPAYNYLARRLELTLHNLDLDPGSPPSEAERAEISALASGAGSTLLLWESEPVEPGAGVSGVIGVVVSPCEQPPVGGDYLGAMADSIDRLRAALAGRAVDTEDV